jgi:quercetin dioxygenase-like cupin family protein
MNTTLILAAAVLIASAGATAQLAHAQQAGVTRDPVLTRDSAIAGREIIQARITVAPGVVAARHSHPGDEIAYVLSGALEYQIDGQPPVTLKPGDALFIPSGAIHSAKNVGDSPATELATYFVEKGKPLLVTASPGPR